MLHARVIIFLSWLFLANCACADIELRDDTGQPLRLKQSPQRIISLAPNITELLFAAGAGQRIVGVSKYSDYPAAAQHSPRVGGALLDLETIAALHPDMIVAWADGTVPAQLQRLK